MRRFEHLVVTMTMLADLQAAMDKYDLLGWELVTVVDGNGAFVLVFRRPIEGAARLDPEGTAELKTRLVARVVSDPIGPSRTAYAPPANEYVRDDGERVELQHVANSRVRPVSTGKGVWLDENGDWYTKEET
jgi:hypothetical protein